MPVPMQVRLFTAETVQKAVGFYHICHTSSMFENTEILFAKKNTPWMEGIQEVWANFGVRYVHTDAKDR